MLPSQLFLIIPKDSDEKQSSLVTMLVKVFETCLSAVEFEQYISGILEAVYSAIACTLVFCRNFDSFIQVCSFR